MYPTDLLRRLVWTTSKCCYIWVWVWLNDSKDLSDTMTFYTKKTYQGNLYLGRWSNFYTLEWFSQFINNFKGRSAQIRHQTHWLLDYLDKLSCLACKYRQFGATLVPISKFQLQISVSISILNYSVIRARWGASPAIWETMFQDSYRILFSHIRSSHYML